MPTQYATAPALILCMHAEYSCDGDVTMTLELGQAPVSLPHAPFGHSPALSQLGMAVCWALLPAAVASCRIMAAQHATAPALAVCMSVC